MVLHSTAQTKITGQLLDSLSNQNIEYAAIAAYQTDSSLANMGCISNQKGKFVLNDLMPGEYHIIIQHVGFQKKELQKIQISDQKKLDLGTIYLKPSEILLKEAEVTAEYDYMEFKMAKKVVNVAKHINADAGNVIDVLSGVPSIQTDADGNISLRGSSNFIVLIDGRPSVMDASETLNQIPANTVEKVEIITNPGAKYEAEGAMGIINLIMKKQKSLGTSGQITGKIATGDKYVGNAFVNVKSKKWTHQIGANYSDVRKRTESIDKRNWYNMDTTYSSKIASDRDITRRNYKFEAMSVYQFNDKNSVSLNAEAGQWEFDREIQSHISNATLNNLQELNSNSTTFVKNNFADAALNFQHHFDKEGHEIQIDLFYSYIDNNAPNTICESPISQGLSACQIIKNQSFLRNYRNKIDYSLPLLENLNINSGLFYQNKNTNALYDYSLPQLNQQNTISNGEYEFFREEVSAYVEAQTEALGFQIQAGLRLENAKQLIENRIQKEKFDSHDLCLFPSFQISKSLKENHQMSFGYSKRTTRPDEWKLLPILNSTGRNLLHIGNPDLQAEINHLFELSYHYRNNNTMIVSNIYTNFSKKSITQTTKESNHVFYETHNNIDHSNSTWLDFMWNQKISKWFKFSLSSYLQYSKLNGQLENGYEIDQENFTYGGNIRGTFNITKSTLFEILGIYYGPYQLAQGKAEQFYYVDFFLKQYLLKKQLVLMARTHNTFDSGIYVAELEGSNFNTYTWFNYEGPVFYFSITYKWNNFRRKSKSNQLDMNYDSGLDH